jgi:hypothetical protein
MSQLQPVQSHSEKALISRMQVVLSSSASAVMPFVHLIAHKFSI